jgi:hypothetical protein
VALAVATATVVQPSGWNGMTHYALIKSLAAGSPTIDSYQHWTGDKALHAGHWYADKAPGLSILSVPAYAVLTFVVPAARLNPHESRARPSAQGEGLPNGKVMWGLHLWAALIPFAVTLLLVQRLGNRIEPRLGAPAAVVVGAGTLLLPFSTMLFAHVLSACLGFAAFAILWSEREGAPRPLRLGAAGLLVGLGITVEYPILLIGIALGLYALAPRREGSTSRPNARIPVGVHRALAYALGVAAGMIPLLAYNQWVFGSPTHVAYADRCAVSLCERDVGFLGFVAPKPDVLISLLLSSRGLLTLSPALLLAVGGIVLLYRRGRRAEAYTVGAVAVAYIVYPSGFFLPYGGWTPGPRYLIPALPFLGLPLALSMRRLPGPAIALGLASIVTMVVATITNPLVPNDASTGWWSYALTHGHFQTTVVSVAGVADGWLAVAPFLVGVAAALALAGAAARERLALSLRQTALGGTAVLAWATFAVFGPTTLGIDASGSAAAPDRDYGQLPLFGLAAVALIVALTGLFVALVLPRMLIRNE